MGGHIVLVVQNSELHEQLIQKLAGDGYCALCFHSVEEAVLYLKGSECPAFVAVFNVTVRRQSDYNALAELHAARPELQLLFAGQERSQMLDLLANNHNRVRVLDKPLNHAESGTAIRLALRSVSADFEPVTYAANEFAVGGTSALPYSEEFLRRVGMADVPVLLSGETGVGKEVMARRLRAYSARANKPFLKLNCAALPSELAESELFGCAKGAFTGALADRQGRFETADSGTILLDEIGDMDLRLQTKLLQVLQDGEIQPLGSSRTIKVNVRIMAATHRDLTKAIQDGSFREDLYYRLNVIKILIPPLRERRHEILPLAEALLSRHVPTGQKPPALSEELRRFLTEYHWPGNVRELENVMRRFLVYQDSSMLIQELLEGADDGRPNLALANLASFPDSVTAAESDRRIFSARSASYHSKSAQFTMGGATAGSADRPPAGVPLGPDRLDRLAEASRMAETEVLLEALEANRWNRRQAAASLQIEYKAFLYKLQKYGIVESKIKRREVSA